MNAYEATMRFRVVNDDDPMDFDFADERGERTLDSFAHEPDLMDELYELGVGEHVTIGGGASVQFTITRTR